MDEVERPTAAHASGEPALGARDGRVDGCATVAVIGSPPGRGTAGC